MRENILFVIVFAVFFISSIESVSFINKCKSDDSKCAKASTQVAIPILAAGLPEYGIKPLDPVSFKKIDASSNNLKLILVDSTVTGLKDCMAKKIKRDKPKSKLFIKLLCSANLEGQYEMNGKLLFLPIEGKGPVHAKLRKAEISVEVDLGDKNDKWTIKEWQHSFELKDKSEIVFDNLFDGNDILGNAARELIANNGNDIILEIGPPVIKTVLDEVIKSVKNYLKPFQQRNFPLIKN